MRILVTRTDRIGDFVLSTPIFKALREKYPEAWIAGLTFSTHRELIEGNPYLDEFVLYDKADREKSWWGNFQFSRLLARKKFDVVIHLHATNRMHLVTWLAGIPKRIGWSRRAAWTLTENYPYVKARGEKHEAFYNFELLRSLGITPPQNLETFVPTTSKQLLSTEELLTQKGLEKDKPWVIFNPSASDVSKMWPLDKFCTVANELAQNYDVHLVVIGSKKDSAHVQKFLQGVSEPVCNLGGLLSLGMLGVLLKKSALLISNDSGPVHVAQAVGTSVVSIFHKRLDPGLSPERWKPLYENGVVLAGEEVTENDVLAAAEKWLSQYKKVSASK